MLEVLSRASQRSTSVHGEEKDTGDLLVPISGSLKIPRL